MKTLNEKQKELLKLSVIEKRKLKKALAYYCEKCNINKSIINPSMRLFDQLLRCTLRKLDATPKIVS